MSKEFVRDKYAINVFRNIIIKFSIFTAVILNLSSFTLAEYYKNWEKKIVCKYLSNGLKIIILPRHQNSTVSSLVYVDIGSVNEEPGKSGLAHLVEHILFSKGTNTIGTTNYELEKDVLEIIDNIFQKIRKEKRKKVLNKERLKNLETQFKNALSEAQKYVIEDEFANILQRKGAIHIDAQTHPDYTIYFCSFPSKIMELWIKFESENLINPVMRQFYQEKNVVIEEKLLHDEKPFNKLINLMLSVAYLEHPYRRHVSGYIPDLENVRSKDALDFIKKNYLFNNITIILVGDIDSKKTTNLIEYYFKQDNGIEALRSIIPNKPTQTGERRVEVENFIYPALLIAYHRPKASHPDNPVFDILASLFAGYRSSKVYKQIVIDKNIASSIECYSRFHGAKYSSLFLFCSYPFTNNNIAIIESIIYRHIEELKKGFLNKKELNKAKKNVITKFEKKMESNLDIAIQLAYFENIVGDWRKMFQYENEIKEVTEEDIQRVVKKYFNKKNRTVVFSSTNHKY